MSELFLTTGLMLVCSVVMGRLMFLIDGTGWINNISRKLMAVIPWDFEEIKASAIGIWYYIAPAIFTVFFCIAFDHNLLHYLKLELKYIPYIPITILAQMSVMTMMSGCLTVFSPNKDWAGEIGNISWIKSIQKRNKAVVPLVPVLGAFVEETFFRGTVFLILYTDFEQLGFVGAFLISGFMFTIEQLLFTGNRSQFLSMLLGSLGLSFVACASVAYTGSFLPCLLAHECFLVFYFGKFKYY